MARPEVTIVAEELYASLGPWYDMAVEHEAHEHFHLLEMCDSTGRLLQPVEDIVRDSDTHPGWGVVMDPDNAPIDWLPWLAQFAGKRIRLGLPEAEQRARIRDTDGFDRGTPRALEAAAKQYLTGTKYALIQERFGGNAWRVNVVTLESETPDPGAVLAALMEQKPAGIILTHNAVTGGDFNTVTNTWPSFDYVVTVFLDFDELRNEPSKRAGWSYTEAATEVPNYTTLNSQYINYTDIITPTT